MKKIWLIHTGGTIAMADHGSKNGIQISERHPLDLFQTELQAAASITVEQFSSLPSPHIGPETILDLSNHIRKRLASEEFDGIVITHGTDTLEETAYMLDLLKPCRQPIVLTGAMKSSNEWGADGPNNVLSAIRVAASLEANDSGAVVVMNDEIHAAKYVTKVHASSVAAFESPLIGPIGIVTKKDVLFFNHLKREISIPVQKLEKRVHLLKLYSGIEEEVLNHIEKMQLDGLVVEAFGLGNVPPILVPFFKRFMDRQISVVLVSRSLKGIVQGVYGYEGGGKQLEDLGVIFAKGLTGQKARIKLLLALHQTNAFDELKRMFE